MNARRTKQLLLRWHLPGLLFGSVAFRAVTWLGDAPGHRGELVDVIAVGHLMAVCAVLFTPLLLANLLLWDRVTSRFSALESIRLVRALGLVSRGDGGGDVAGVDPHRLRALELEQRRGAIHPRLEAASHGLLGVLQGSACSNFGVVDRSARADQTIPRRKSGVFGGDWEVAAAEAFPVRA